MATVSLAAASKPSRDHQQHRHTLKSKTFRNDAGRDDLYSGHPGICDGGASSDHHRLPVHCTRSGHDAVLERDDGGSEDERDHQKHCHQRSTWNEDYPGQGTLNMQSTTSWLDLLDLDDDDDDDTATFRHGSREDNSYSYRRETAYYRSHQDRRDHSERPTPDYAGSHAAREARARTRSPVLSHSRCPSRSPSPRGRAAVHAHDDLREDNRDLSRDESRIHGRYRRSDAMHSDARRRQKSPPRSRSVPGRSASHTHRRSSFRRGPSSSSAASNNSSSSMSAWESAARNALRAGTMAAITNYSAPGKWLGDKGKRVATAALGAALVDTYMGHRHPESVNGVRHTAMRQVAEYAINSIVAEPIMQRAARHRTRQ